MSREKTRSRVHLTCLALLASGLAACGGETNAAVPDASASVPSEGGEDAGREPAHAASAPDAGLFRPGSERDTGVALLAPTDAGTPDAASRGKPSSTPLSGPRGASAGCGKAAPAGTASGWSKHDLTVQGVAARYLQGGDKYGSQGGYDFGKRNYFLRLPARYDDSKPYPLVISGAGCGATDGMSGNGGGSNPLPDNQDSAVQVGLSYVYANKDGACFEDGSADTPDLPYFDAVLAELDRTYCFDRAQVFVSGFSSGAWETYMLGCARAGVIRGVGTQAGGLRKERPVCSNLPVAAFLTAGVNDANPISNVDKSGFDSGSEAARDLILKTNGCTTQASAPYVTTEAPADWNCLRYTSCPEAYPVIWCAITADGGGHGAGSNKAFFPFWIALPKP
jgi:poly(3-hydroxybutyrate) depolymerase